MNHPDHLQQFIRSFRYLLLISVGLFILSLIAWPYLNIDRWFVIILLINSIILSTWLFLCSSYLFIIYSKKN